MDRDHFCEVDPASPPASVGLEWCRLVATLEAVTQRSTPDAPLTGDQLAKATAVVLALWALVDPVARWLVAEGLADAPFVSQHHAAALEAIREPSTVIDDLGVQGALVAASVRCVGTSRDHVSSRGAASIGADPLLEPTVEAIEEEFMDSTGDPVPLLIEEYTCLQLRGDAGPQTFLVSRRGDEWFLVLWPWMWRRLPGFVPNGPSGSGGTSGVREPAGPRPPHAQGGAAMPLPED